MVPFHHSCTESTKVYSILSSQLLNGVIFNKTLFFNTAIITNKWERNQSSTVILGFDWISSSPNTLSHPIFTIFRGTTMLAPLFTVTESQAKDASAIYAQFARSFTQTTPILEWTHPFWEATPILTLSLHFVKNQPAGSVKQQINLVWPKYCLTVQIPLSYGQTLSTV